MNGMFLGMNCKNFNKIASIIPPCIPFTFTILLFFFQPLFDKTTSDAIETPPNTTFYLVDNLLHCPIILYITFLFHLQYRQRKQQMKRRKQQNHTLGFIKMTCYNNNIRRFEHATHINRRG